jgi:hypothetical protein
MEKLSAKVKRPLWVAGLNIALALSVGSAQAFADDTYNIASQADLENIGVTVGDGIIPRPLDGNYVVTRSFEVVGPVSEGSSTYVTGTFTGTFDGGGFIISGLTKPLFEIIDGNQSDAETTISDLTLEAAEGGVSGAGILAERVYSGTVIDNVDVTGDVIGGNEVGGLVGYNEGTISNSSATGNVTGSNSLIYEGVGGLVGANAGTISNSSAAVTVIGNNYVGGLAGFSNGVISNSYASGDVTGDWYVGGLVGQTFSDISNSYASGDVTGDRVVGGLAGSALGEISNSYASGNIEFDIGSFNADSSYFGGLAGEAAYQPITNSYASGNIEFDITPFDPVGRYVGGFLGFFGTREFVVGSYASGNVNDTTCGEDCPPLNDAELLVILNTGSVSPIFALNANINSGRPYLLSHLPPGEDNGDEDNGDEDNGDEEVSPRFYLSLLPTQALDRLSKSVGFEVAKSELSKFDLALLDQVKGDSSAQIIGAKLFSYQSLSTSLLVGSLLQLEINYEANKSLQMWVKSLDDQYVLIGNITFDKDGNAVLPGIEFKKSGQYELIFVNSDKKDLTQSELVNKVSGLTVYVN